MCIVVLDYFINGILLIRLSNIALSKIMKYKIRIASKKMMIIPVKFMTFSNVNEYLKNAIVKNIFIPSNSVTNVVPIKK